MSVQQKDPDALRTIGEVAEGLGIATHVLRFWEGKFPEINPQKRRGRRYYGPEDINLIKQIKILLYDQGLTIKGVRKYFQDHKDVIKKISSGEAQPVVNDPFKRDLFGNIIPDINAENDDNISGEQTKPSIKKSDLEKLKKILQSLQTIKNKLNA